MRKQNTRFAPTMNGRLHVGHLFTLLVNEYEAHSTGGKFIIRCDDMQAYWKYIRGVSPNQMIDSMKADLGWLGLLDRIDDIETDGNMLPEVRRVLEQLNTDALYISKDRYKRLYSDTVPEIISTVAKPYPYVPYLTAEKVVADFLQDITLLIRGEDLLNEYSLYTFLCDAWGIPIPRQVFLPRLVASDGGELADLSKTSGGYAIHQLIQEENMSPAMIMQKLRQSCLKDPTRPFSLLNVKERPVWIP